MMANKTWEVSFDGAWVDCETEHDAKMLAQELVRKGHRVTAGTLKGHSPPRSVDTGQMGAWFSE